MSNFFWTIQKSDKNRAILILNGSNPGYGDIVSVEVPDDEDKEDYYVKMAFTIGEDALMDLNEFNAQVNDFSKLFHESDFSSHDFVSRWKKLISEGKIQVEPATTDSSDDEAKGSENAIAIEDNSEDSVQEHVGSGKQKKRKRRETGSVSGLKRAKLAWQRNTLSGSDRHGVHFGAEGWPPPFRSWVSEMRQRIIIETGKNDNWNYDDIALLRKYYYLKHNIPPKNTSTIAIAVKLAVMSDKCYALAEQIMDMYEDGELDRKKSNDGACITIRGGYFAFLYCLNPITQEEEIYNRLKFTVENKTRPERKVGETSTSKKPTREDDDNQVKSLEEKMSNVKQNLTKKVKEAATMKSENDQLKQKVQQLNKAVKERDREVTLLKTELMNVTSKLEKSEKDNRYLASSLETTTEDFRGLKKKYEKIREENRRLVGKVRTTPKRLTEKQSSLETEIERLRNRHEKKAAELQKEKKALAPDNNTCTEVEDLDDENQNGQGFTEDDVTDTPQLLTETNDRESENEEDDNEKYESIRPGDWVAVDYANCAIYIGKVTKVNEDLHTAEASFPNKLDGKRYKEKENKERSIDSFHLSQVYSTALELEFRKNGIVVLKNKDVLAKMLETRKKNR